MTTYTTRLGDTVDSICASAYGRTSGTVEAVLEANRGLAELGPKLARGLVIVLPTISVESTETEKLY